MLWDARDVSPYLTFKGTCHHIPLKGLAIPETIFSTTRGKCVFQRLPIGLACALSLFTRLLDAKFAHFGPVVASDGSGSNCSSGSSGSRNSLLAYVDDILSCSDAWDQHVRLIQETCQALLAARLTLHPFDAGVGLIRIKIKIESQTRCKKCQAEQRTIRPCRSELSGKRCLMGRQ